MDAMEKAQMMEDCAANSSQFRTQQIFTRWLRSTRDACLEGTWRVMLARNHGGKSTPPRKRLSPPNICPWTYLLKEDVSSSDKPPFVTCFVFYVVMVRSQTYDVH